MTKNNNNKNKQKQQAQIQSAIGKINGKGGYYSDKIVPLMRKIVPDGTFSNVGRTLGGLAGTSLGTMVAQPLAGGALGSAAGSTLGGKISQFLGFGKYTVKKNSLLKEGGSLAEGVPLPSFGVIGHETRVRHREFIGDVVASNSSFVYNLYTINPGMAATFPWLSTLAQSYQQYKFNGLVFEFVSTSSDITSGGALGSVILATQYDANALPYPDKLHMENSEYCVSAKPSLSQVHACECDPAVTSVPIKYIRSVNEDTSKGYDARMYDMGVLQVANKGVPSSSGTVLGELWVTYDVSLFKPELGVNAFDHAIIINGSSCSNTLIFGNNAGVTVSPPGAVTSSSGNSIVFTQAGSFFVALQIAGSGLTTPGTSSSTGSVQYLANSPTSGTTSLIELFTVKISAPNQTIAFDASGCSSVSSAIAYVCAY